MVNGNSPVAPVADFKTTNSVSSTTAARSGSRSVLKATNRPQNAAKASAVDGTATTKPSQSKEQAEKKKQAIAQLKRMLIQGNKRVEALATVIQHVFSEVLQLNLGPLAMKVDRYHCPHTLASALAEGLCARICVNLKQHSYQTLSL